MKWRTVLQLLRRRIENFFYKKIVANIMFTSRLGRRTIFGYADSGINFDKIYLNKPNGYNKFGTFVEYMLLNLPAAKATRNRQVQLKKIIGKEIQKNLNLDIKTRIVNLASGPSRYLTEVISKKDADLVEILCFDADTNSLMLGKALSKDFYTMRFIKANVFKLKRYKRLGEKVGWRANIILASGLYFYYNDKMVRQSFKEVYDNLDSNGLFVFDNLVGNPNKKLLAKVGITTSGKAWEFYYRTQSQIISWLSDAGFSNIEAINDPWKMYIIYKAHKPKLA